VGGTTANATLSEAQLAAHNHPAGASPFRINLSNSGGNNVATTGNTGTTGSGTGHQHNMSATFAGDATSVVQPYLTILYVIKT